MSDLKKIQKVLQRFRAPEAPTFTCYERIPHSNAPENYFKFCMFSRDLEAPAADLFASQHYIREVFVHSASQNSSFAPVSKVK